MRGGGGGGGGGFGAGMLEQRDKAETMKAWEDFHLQPLPGESCPRNRRKPLQSPRVLI